MSLTPRRRLTSDVVTCCVTILFLVTLCASAFAQRLPIPTQIRLDPITKAPFAVLGDGRQFRLLTPAQVREGQRLTAQIVNLPDQIQLRRNGPWVIKGGPPPATFDLMSSQTGIRNQSLRETCTYFSTTAAMEAAYKRAGFGDLDLSEQFMIWLRDVTMLADAEQPTAPSQTDATKRECQLGSVSGGGSSYNIMLMTKYGICREADDPYIGSATYDSYSSSYYAGYPLVGYSWDIQSFPQAPINNWNFAAAQFSEAARNDLRYGVDEFVSLSAAEFQNPSTLESIIASGHEVIIDLNLYSGPIDPARPAWVYVPGQSEVGGHSMLFIGYDRPRHFFVVKNSWGPTVYNAASLATDWRDITRFDGYQLVDYSYLQTAYSGAYINHITPPNGGKYNQERVLGNWDLHFYNKTTNAEVSHGTIAWRHIPGTSWGLPHADKRVGDYTDSTGHQFRVDADIRGGITNNITLYIDLSRPAQRYNEANGTSLVGTLRAYGAGEVSVAGESMIPPACGSAGSLFGLPYNNLTFYATHR